MKKWFVFFALSFAFYSGGFATEFLKESDIHRVMGEILKEHIGEKQLTHSLLQNSLSFYINQFDPERIYLLEQEVVPYLYPTSSLLNQTAVQYKQQNYTLFKQLDHIFQRAIERARKMRQQIYLEEKILFKRVEKTASRNQKAPFPNSLAELKERMVHHLNQFITLRAKRFGLPLTAKSNEKSLNAYEIKRRDFENQYLYQNEQGQPLAQNERENLFAIHVLKALAKTLDSHTSFFKSNEAYDLKVRLKKEFDGIGLVLKETPDDIVVSHLLEGGPAERSKSIQLGDVLLEIDGQSVISDSLEKVMKLLRGEKNSKVKLAFRHGGSDEKFTVELNRERMILNNDRVDVSSEPFGNGIIGKINLHGFYNGEKVSSEKDVREAIEQLEKQGNLRGVILDLRNNSGGFLSQAIHVAGLFITDGIVVISKYADGKERIYRDVDNAIEFDGPLIVLTSRATASAAEIVAQALQDYGVALVVGDEHTYGKGTIQTQTVTDNKSASYFKVTVGTYYTVSGHTPQKQGVKADIVVPSHWSREKIGEIYTDSIVANTIPAAYDDKLTDIPPQARPWYLKYYLPKLQQRTEKWRELLPQLTKNSAHRMDQNKNYQYFLKGGQGEEQIALLEEEWDLSGKNKTIGEDDLQMQEAVNILKDMILLHRKN